MPNIDFSGANLFAGLLFGSIGFSAFIYGKKQGSAKTMIIALALCFYPWVVSNIVANYAIGAALTAALFIFRD